MRLFLLAFAIVSASFVLGCQRADQIQAYPVPKEAAPPVVASADNRPTDQNAEPTDRMLAAILPAGNRAWFFKVAGPISAVDKQADAVDDFFNSVSVKPGSAKPEWKLPQGWTEQAGTGMRAATIMVPGDGKPLELSVIGLPWTGAPGEVLSNINRWRGQMKLPEVEQTALADITREIKVGDATMTIVDLRGEFSAGNMAAPFAGGGPFSGGVPRSQGAAMPSASPSGRGNELSSGEGDLPAGHPPVDTDRVAQAAPFTFKAPSGWQSLPATGMRKAVFEIKEGDQQALVTAIDFPATAGPKIADPLENVNRWRREVGLDEINQDDLEGAIEKIEVDGNEAQYVEMIPDAAKPAESHTQRATLAAIVTAGDRIWFFKLTGSRDLVAGERDNFQSFLKSVRFTSDDGT